MGTVYAFFADGFEEIEAFTAIDTLRPVSYTHLTLPTN